MRDFIWDELQNSVDNYLIRHRSILDVLTKLQESTARINRAVVKSITTCGCIKIDAKKQDWPSDLDGTSIEEVRHLVSSHLEGEMCPHCRDVIEAELGNHAFYLAALCNLTGISLYDALVMEKKRIDTLGIYRFS